MWANKDNMTDCIAAETQCALLGIAETFSDITGIPTPVILEHMVEASIQLFNGYVRTFSENKTCRVSIDSNEQECTTSLNCCSNMK